MKIQVSNPSFLNAEKIKLHTVNHSAHQGIPTRKKTNCSPTKRKSQKPIVSFLNFQKNKQPNYNQNECQPSISCSVQNKIEETFEFHEFQEHQSNMSEIGSQYGQKNYDNDLKEVLKKRKHSVRKQYNTPKVSLRTNTDQKENLQRPSSKYERFEKFQNELKKKDSKADQETFNYQPYDLQGAGNNKMSGFCPQSHKIQHRAKTETHYKNQSFFTDPKTLQEKQQKESIEKTPEFQTLSSKPFELINSITTFQPIQFKRESRNTSPSHRRSRTHDDAPLSDNQKAEQIFQNYHQIKKKFYKAAKNKDHSIHDCIKSKTPIIIQTCEKQMKAQQNHSKLMKENNRNYRSLPKCYPMALSQNIHHFDPPTSRAIMTPKSLTRTNMNEQTLVKKIQQRKKEFFEQANGKPFELSNFTFNQIKQKLSKLELNEAKKIHNKSHNILANKNVLLYSDLFVSGEKSKEQTEEQKLKQRTIKFKGIAFKANLIRKHTDIYEKHFRKMIDKNLSLKVTPKVSQLAIDEKVSQSLLK